MKKIIFTVLLLVAVSTYVSAQVRSDTTQKRDTTTNRMPPSTNPDMPRDTSVRPGNRGTTTPPGTKSDTTMRIPSGNPNGMPPNTPNPPAPGTAAPGQPMPR